MMKKKILLVNDDGFGSIGISVLEELLAPFGEVCVVAPKAPMSGKSVAITIYEPLTISKKGKNRYEIDGTPADCVSYGLTHLGVDFDYVVSGINYGHNISYDVMHSGTCGACVEANLFNKPAIALSCDGNFDIVKKYFDDVMDYIFNRDLLSSTDYFLNVNFPFDEKVKGIVFSSLSVRNDRRYFKNKDEQTIILARDLGSHEELENTGDVYLINNGYISITPLMKTCFSRDVYEKLKKDKKIQ